MMRHWQLSPPGRWLTALSFASRGVRIAPSAALVGARTQFAFGRGVAVGRGCVIRADKGGRVELGEGVWLARDCEIETATRVQLGARTTVQRRCTINGTTRLGEDCILAPDVFISSGTHPFREIPHLPIREQERLLAGRGESFDRPVWIQDDCWIGTHAVVAPGVTIGKGSVIGANSVVTRDVPPYSVVAGMPAKVIGHRLEWRPPAAVDCAAEAQRPYLLCLRDPLLVALGAQPGQPVIVRLRCSKAAPIAVNGAATSLTPATTELRCTAAEGLPFGATVRIDGALDGIEFTSFQLEP